jgi:hypothetical protein
LSGVVVPATSSSVGPERNRPAVGSGVIMSTCPVAVPSLGRAAARPGFATERTERGMANPTESS